MAVEIERKFLVKKKPPLSKYKSIFIEQGYLNDDPCRLVRVRITDEKAFMTIKGKGTGISRPEFEYEIPVIDARELIKMAIYPIIVKKRHIINFAGKKWELDVFRGENKGLIIAEVELQSENEIIEIPDWVDEEVTGDNRFFNYNLASCPYISW